jgi:hypothetical protein
MNTAIITCPNCGTEVALSEALQGHRQVGRERAWYEPG